jgi:hypothetical protein
MDLWVSTGTSLGNSKNRELFAWPKIEIVRAANPELQTSFFTLIKRTFHGFARSLNLEAQAKPATLRVSVPQQKQLY